MTVGYVIAVLLGSFLIFRIDSQIEILILILVLAFIIPLYYYAWRKEK